MCATCLSIHYPSLDHPNYSDRTAEIVKFIIIYFFILMLLPSLRSKYRSQLPQIHVSPLGWETNG
jgi:hypothetical protein